MAKPKPKQEPARTPSDRALQKAMDLIEVNIAFGDIDDDTATVTTGGLIGDVAGLFDRIAEKDREIANLQTSVIRHVK